METVKQPEWYIADLVILFWVVGSDEDLLHINTKLLKAGSPEEAFEKALKAGTEYNYNFTNTDGALVEVKFLGLRELLHVAEDLEDGCELYYEEVAERHGFRKHGTLKSKDNLAVFKTSGDGRQA